MTCDICFQLGWQLSACYHSDITVFKYIISNNNNKLYFYSTFCAQKAAQSALSLKHLRQIKVDNNK